MEHISALVRARKSVRTFDGTPLRDDDRARLSEYLEQIETPFDVPMEFRLLDAKEHGLSSPVVVSSELYAAGKLRHGPLAEVAFGFAFEKFVLYAASLGVGTVWIAGTMDRPAFERAMELTGDEFLPAVTPLGYPAKKRAIRDAAMRRAIKADARAPFESLFFENDFGTPLTAERAGEYREALELVRLAPSAVNKQPWRIVASDGAFHFYLKHSLPANPKGDVQKLDIGIALAHFVLALEAQGVAGHVAAADPGLAHDGDTEYLITWQRD
jgi:nitroreductase